MHDVWSLKPHLLQAVSLITLIPLKLWDWITFSALGRTEPDSPNDSLIHQFYCHICFSVCPFTLSFTVSQLPSWKAIFPVPLSQLSSNCRANYLCTIVISAFRQLPGPAISWATLVIPFEFRLHSIYCVFSHWTQLFCISLRRSKIQRVPKQLYPALCEDPKRTLAVTRNPIRPISKSDFECCLQIT